MLYLIYGSGSAGRIKQKDSLLAKHASAEIIIRSGDTVTVSEIEQIARGSSLFDEKLFLILDGLFENEERGEMILDRLSMLQESSNAFLVYERELKRDIVKAFEKEEATIFLSEEIKKTPKREFNVFGITDALTVRDKKKAWLLYREAIAHETEPEAIHGALFWSLKNMLMLADTKGTAGLNPFVASKARAGLSHWKKEELVARSRELIHLVHRAHGGKMDFEEGLEEFVLCI